MLNTIYHRYLHNRSLAYTWSHAPTRTPLVVLHGLGDSSIHTYAPRFASTVLQDTPSLFIDLPGFGESSARDPYPATIEDIAADVADLLGFLKVEGVPIFAHSMGANVAITLVHTYPALASELIVAEPLLDPERSVLAAGIAKHSEHDFVSQRYDMLVRATSLQMQRGNTVAAAFLPTLRMANPTMLYRAAASLIRTREPDFREMLFSLQVPGTLLAGQLSDFDTSRLDNKLIQVRRVHNAGHTMMVEQEESTAYAIFDIVSRLR